MSERQFGMPADLRWRQLVRQLCRDGLAQSPRGLETVELIGCQSIVDMTHPVVCSTARKLSYKFMAAEALWIISGDDRVQTIARYAPSIAKFSDDGIRFFGAYGPKIINQLSYIVASLIRDQSSRQSVLTIWRENPRQTKDYPCTVSVQWLIREGKLHCIDTMRSSDAWLGWPYDVFNFSMISLLIGMMLRDVGGVKVDLGCLMLNAGSQHLYQKNMSGALDVIAEDTYQEGPEFHVDDFESPEALDMFLHVVKQTGGFPS